MLHLGTPGQRRPTVSVEQVQSPRQLKFSVGGSRTTLEELMKKDHEMKLLKKAKLKNTTVKGKVRELVHYGEQIKMSAESVDAHILAEFGLQGGRKLAKTLEGLIPTNREELEQDNFVAQWRTVGVLSACQEVTEKGVGGILRHIFQGVKRNALVGAKEFLLYGPETSPEELEKALIRYDRKTEIIQSEKEKSHTTNNGVQKTSLGDQSEKGSRIIVTKGKACLLRDPIIGQIRDGKKGKRGQKGMIRNIKPEEVEDIEISRDPERSKTKALAERAVILARTNGKR